MKKASVKRLLKEKERLEWTEGAIKDSIQKQIRAVEEQIKRQRQPELDAVQQSLVENKQRRQACNPAQVDDLIEERGPDGASNGRFYKVTGVRDEVRFFARLVMSKGKLGVQAYHFAPQSSYGEEYDKFAIVRQGMGRKRVVHVLKGIGIR